MDTTIESIFGRQILDSRGNPTIEVDVKTNNGFGRAKIPSGASTGEYEAVELRDNNPDIFNGKSVMNAVNNVNDIIAKKITGMDAKEQEEIDRAMIELDGTPNKANLGANAILGVSLACARAASNSMNMQLHQYLAQKYTEHSKYIMPVPMMNVLNGGKHAGSKLQMQEFMIMPIGETSFSSALQTGVQCYHELKTKIKNKYGKSAVNVGDEGGYAPPFTCPEEPLDLLVNIIEEYGGGQDNLMIAMDPAASEFYDSQTQKYTVGQKQYSPGELIDYYADMIKTYPICSLEDPLEENDFEGFAELTGKTNIQIVGDDLFVTNTERIQEGIDKKSANALLLKLNQIGTLTESVEAFRLSKKNDFNVVVSHRSGETCDAFISDFSAGLGSGQLKTGAPARSERTEKYNQLLRIEEMEEDNCTFSNPFK
ncbi:MAG: phosphopyruvate hydratase [Candidatus Aenigmarchaeota archaeon]|nr:phosphopyruvate hydratase [Candidatus Aenigmarchaeota archaeon]